MSDITRRLAAAVPPLDEAPMDEADIDALLDEAARLCVAAQGCSQNAFEDAGESFAWRVVPALVAEVRRLRALSAPPLAAIVTRTALALGGLPPIAGCEDGGPERIPAMVAWLRREWERLRASGPVSAPAAPGGGVMEAARDVLALDGKATAGPWGRHGYPAADGQINPTRSMMEAAPGLSIGSGYHTEPIARCSGYLLPVEANTDLITRYRTLAVVLARAVLAGGGEGNGDA